MTNQMTPIQLIKFIYLNSKVPWASQETASKVTGDMVDKLFDKEFPNRDGYSVSILLANTASDIRSGTEETGLACEYSQSFESKSVASKAPNGQWVGWTYWYGGGKHSYAEETGWAEDAYLLDMLEESRTFTAHIFTKVTPPESKD